MDLYVFNPEHDIVLASGGDRLTPPRAAMLKAPWSSSGRGVRRATLAEMTPQMCGWAAHVVAEQGCVMVEPYYNKGV